MYKVVLDFIIDNTASLAQLFKYGAINADDPTITGYYVIKHLSETYALQEDQAIYWQSIEVG